MQDAIATATAARSTSPACRTQKTTVCSIARVSITVVDVYASRPRLMWRDRIARAFRSLEPLAQRPLRPAVPGSGPIPWFRYNRGLPPWSRRMQLATSGPVTGLMYKGLSLRSVSRPGRISAPGFVLPAQKLCASGAEGGVTALHKSNNDVSGQMIPGERMVARRVFWAFNLRLKNRP